MDTYELCMREMFEDFTEHLYGQTCDAIQELCHGCEVGKSIFFLSFKTFWLLKDECLLKNWLYVIRILIIKKNIQQDIPHKYNMMSV